MKISLECSSFIILTEYSLQLELTSDELIQLVGIVNRALREEFNKSNRKKRKSIKEACFHRHVYTEETRVIREDRDIRCRICQRAGYKKRATRKIRDVSLSRL